MAILSHIILVDYDPSMGLRSISQLENLALQNEVMYEGCIRNSEEEIGLEDFLSTLLKMSNFCNQFMMTHATPPLPQPPMPLLIPLSNNQMYY